MGGGLERWRQLGFDQTVLFGRSIFLYLHNYGTIIGQFCRNEDCTVWDEGAVTVGSEPRGLTAAESGIVVNNYAEGLISAGPILDVDRLNNEGALAVGGGGTLGTTYLSGNLTQAEGGTLAFDLDPQGEGSSGYADLLSIGGQADLGGRIAIRLIDDWAPTLGVRSSAVAQYGLHQPSEDTLSLLRDRFRERRYPRVTQRQPGPHRA